MKNFKPRPRPPIINAGENSKVTSKWYFLVAAITPIFLALFFAVVIYVDLKPDWDLTSKGVRDFVQIYDIPLRLIMIGVVLQGLAFAYHRSEVTFAQNERQIVQLNRANFDAAREEFLSLLERGGDEFLIIDIPSSWLVSTLYPRDKFGLHSLSPDFEKFINDPSEGFLAVISSFKEQHFNAGDPENTLCFYGSTYTPLARLYSWFRRIFHIDATIPNDSSPSLFEGERAKKLTDALHDMNKVVVTVNASEGWRFFDNEDRQVILSTTNEILHSRTIVPILRQQAASFVEHHEGVKAKRVHYKSPEKLVKRCPEFLWGNERARWFIATSTIENGSLDASSQRELLVALKLLEPTNKRAD